MFASQAKTTTMVTRMTAISKTYFTIRFYLSCRANRKTSIGFSTA